VAMTLHSLHLATSGGRDSVVAVAAQPTTPRRSAEMGNHAVLAQGSCDTCPLVDDELCRSAPGSCCPRTHLLEMGGFEHL